VITIPIHIDMEGLIEEFSMTNEQVLRFHDDVVGRIAILFATQLEQEAQRVLHKTRNRYIRSIKLYTEGIAHKAVVLDMSDSLIAMIENGASPFDMKAGMLASPKAKTGKSGQKYLTIPFRWAVPTSLGESEVFSFKMPISIHKVAKSKKVTIPIAGGGFRAAGLSNKEIPAEHSAQTSRLAIVGKDGAVLFDEYKHKTNIYAGIAKYTDGVTNQNMYKSFRRVSENSDPLAFIHPGIKQYDLFSKALDSLDVNMENELSMAVDNSLSSMGFS